MNYRQACIISTLSAGNIQHNILVIPYFCATSHMTQPLSMGDLTRSVAMLAKIDFSNDSIVKQVFMLLMCYTSIASFQKYWFSEVHAYKLNLV